MALNRGGEEWTRDGEDARLEEVRVENIVWSSENDGKSMASPQSGG